MSINSESKSDILNNMESLQKTQKNGIEDMSEVIQPEDQGFMGFVCAGVKTSWQRNVIKQYLIFL